ncbi:MAG: penicillin-binding protein activator LpoB [Sulfuricella denitrificans]|nr:penicillin-binding protein activator LpoB [Sulfuricella denitrificans]
MFIRNFVFALFAFMSCVASAQAANEPALPKIAVTDLSYEEKVREYFHVVAAQQKSSYRGKYSERERESDYSYSAGSRGSVNAKSESSYYEASGSYTYIDRGELHKFVSDIKGEMLKSGGYRVFQGRPVTQKDTDKLFDIIDRIKKGYYKGADYVLFGTVSSIQFRDEDTPVQGSETISHIFSLELVADFNLINTKTYEIKAAFSAMGEGSDVKLLSTSRGGRIVPNRGRVMSDVSKTLGLDVARQLEEQFSPAGGYRSGSSSSTTVIEKSSEKVIIYK